MGEWTDVVGSEEDMMGAAGVLSLDEGEDSRLSSIDRTACSNSPQARLNSRPRAGWGVSSPSEFSEESGGDKIAPVGINRLLRGEGD